METKQEMKTRFGEMIHEAVFSDECWKQKVATNISQQMFDALTEINPTAAKDVMEAMEGQLCYNNYLTEAQARKITSAFVNSADKTTGPKWQPQEVWNLVEDLTGDPEEIDSKPEYNKWALYTTINMIYSDDLKPICQAMKIPLDRESIKSNAKAIAETCYHFAVSKLEDADRPRWIADYFRHEL